MDLLRELDAALHQKQNQSPILQQASDGSTCWRRECLHQKVHDLSRLICRALGAARAAADEDNPPIVGLFLGTSIACIIAMLASLRVRAAFMPLDCRWPPKKLTAVLDDGRPALILWADTACQGCGPVAYDGCPLLQIPSRLLDFAESADNEDEVEAAREQIGSHEQKYSPSELVKAATNSVAYVMYTSGSTGSPQAVLGTAEGILNRCRWMQRAFPFTAGDVVCFHTAPSFVDSIWQVFGPLLGGVPLLVLPPSALHDMGALFKALQQHAVTHFIAVPTVLAALMRHMEFSGQEGPPSLRLLVSSGEPLPAEKRRRQPSAYPGNLVSAGAAASIAAGMRMETAPVGWPLDNMGVFIAAPIGEAGERSIDGSTPSAACMSAADVLGRGQVGEVCVLGAGLCTGYLRRPEQTKRRFTSITAEQLEAASENILWGEQTNKYSGLTGANSRSASERVFRTGDLGIITSHGLEIRGRLDLQSKVGGVRIDLLEVEACLAAHPDVLASAATVWPAGPLKGMRLCAYVELQRPSADVCAELRRWCWERLPAAAVPSSILALPKLPRSSAGKIQRGSLPWPAELAQQDNSPPSDSAAQGMDSRQGDGVQAALPSGFPFAGPGGLEAAAMRAFSAALGLRTRALEPATNFWSAGGDSLAAAQVAGWLGVDWRVNMYECVDASPVILIQPVSEATDEQSSQQDSGRNCQPAKNSLRWYVLGCSHSGDVVCVDGRSGTTIWRAHTNERAESGLTLTGDLQHVAVAASNGQLHFLRTTDGVEVGSCDTDGALKAAPATDPWLGHVWIASHGRQLMICKAPGEIVLRQPITSAVSASVAFDAAGRQAYLGALDGILTAYHVRIGLTGAQTGPKSDEVILVLAWSRPTHSPIFATPAVVPGAAPGHTKVIATGAEGSVMGFCHAGTRLWKTDIGSAIFASPCLITQQGGTITCTA
ncbi:hypothetical protein WJX75_008334 [Coccomyxa subellipsoidea]|uniref:Acetyl-CoA synthetase-like protein n=1 Tax=Coccomyxa subellipsoidea TaxID=248742 RepID=A0ABR2YRF4_9CHLO